MSKVIKDHSQEAMVKDMVKCKHCDWENIITRPEVGKALFLCNNCGRHNEIDFEDYKTWRANQGVNKATTPATEAGATVPVLDYARPDSSARTDTSARPLDYARGDSGQLKNWRLDEIVKLEEAEVLRLSYGEALNLLCQAEDKRNNLITLMGAYTYNARHPMQEMIDDYNKVLEVKRWCFVNLEKEIG